MADANSTNKAVFTARTANFGPSADNAKATKENVGTGTKTGLSRMQNGGKKKR